MVDIDLAKFFDTIHHDRLIFRISQYIEDKNILRIIGLILRSGTMKDGLHSVSEEGAIQGSPLSQLLSNIVLDELDKEIERRGLEFCRFADDSNIFVRSEKAANRVMTSISKFIKRKLRLEINEEKSKVALSKHVKFLGITINGKGRITISAKSMQRAMEKVKELTPRKPNMTIEKTIQEINKWYVGWSGYYKITEYPNQLKKIESRVRRRLRARIVSQQKRQRHLFNKLIKRGLNRSYAGKTVYCNDKCWAMSGKFALAKAFTVSWFVNLLGQKIRSIIEEPKIIVLN